MTADYRGSLLVRMPLWWKLAFSLTVAVALGLGLGLLLAGIERLAVPLPHAAGALGGAGIVGLLAGQAARLVLRERTVTSQFLLALAALLVSMAVAEVAYAAWLWIPPLEHLARASDRLEVGQLAVGGLGIVLVHLVGQPTREATLLRRGSALDVTLAVALGVGTGYVQANARRLGLAAPSLVLPLFGAGMMGLLASLVSRLILKHWTGVLKSLLSFLTLLIWMLVAEGAYAAWRGLPPFDYLALADDWVEVGQLAVGWLAAAAVGLVGQPAREAMSLGGQIGGPRAGASLRWSLALGLTGAAALGVGMGTLSVNAAQRSLPIPAVALSLVGAGAMGLLAGLAARSILRGRAEGLKILLVMGMLLVWLAASEVTYAVWRGLRPLDYVATADNWVESGQLAIGCLMAIIGGVGRRTGAVEVAPALRRSHPSLGHRQTTGRARSARRVRRRSIVSLPQVRLPILGRQRRTAKPAPQLNGQVRITAAQAEDRCPYCLEAVDPNDVRGVTVCEICGTPHHADCWAAGGDKCQVPHLIT